MNNNDFEMPVKPTKAEWLIVAVVLVAGWAVIGGSILWLWERFFRGVILG